MTCAPLLRMPRTVTCVHRSLPFLTAVLMFVASANEVVAQNVSFEERLLATIPRDLDSYNSFVLFPHHGLALLGRGDQWQPVFSSDGRHVAFFGRRDKQAVVVVDGKEGPVFDAVYDFVFSPDGSRFAYVGRTGKEIGGSRWIMVTDHRPGPEFDDVGVPVFAPDGRRLMYTARRTVGGGSRALLVEDDRVISEHDWLGDVAFSPDGKTLAVATGRVVGDSLRCSMRVGETAGPEFVWVGLPTWSRDGAHFAYAAQEGLGKARVFRDGQSVLDAPSIIALRFMAARVIAIEGNPIGTMGRGLVEAEGIFGGRRVLTENGASSVYDEAGLPAVSPDGRRLAYGARNLPKGMRNFQALLVIDGEETKLNRGLTAGVMGDPHVPSGIGNFYALRVGDRMLAGTNRNRLYLRFESVFALALTPLAFSPDGQQVAYTTWGQIRIGEQKSDRFDWAGPPVFSPDGKKIAFGARKGRELWWKVIDVN